MAQKKPAKGKKAKAQPIVTGGKPSKKKKK